MLPLNPIRYLRFASRVVRYHHRVRHRSNQSLWREGQEIYRLLRLNQLEPREYYETYELFDPQFTLEDKRRFLSREQFARLDRALNPTAAVGVLNKLVFKIYAQYFDLPVARMYGLFDQHLGYTVDGEELRTAADLEHFVAKPQLQSFLFKPIGANKAMGIFVCSKRDNKLFVLGEGDTTLAAVYKRLCGSHHSGWQHISDPWLVEERIRQHPWFDRYSPTFTHNYRIVTFLSSKGSIELIGASIGIGLKDQHIHSSGLLGMSAGISDDGVLTPAVRGGVNGLEFFERHPDTGAQIAGERPPGFHESVEVAIRAHSRLPHLRLLGWDIAPTEGQPIIFEGNPYWNWEKLQRCNRRGVVRGSLAEELAGIIGGD
jgi:hypothetical protein